MLFQLGDYSEKVTICTFLEYVQKVKNRVTKCTASYEAKSKSNAKMVVAPLTEGAPNPFNACMIIHP